MITNKYKTLANLLAKEKIIDYYSPLILYYSYFQNI